MGSALGGAVVNIAAPIFGVIMFAIWQAGVALLKFVLSFFAGVTEPDVSFDGPISGAMPVILWLSLSLVTLFTVLQLLVTLTQRSGERLAELVWGLVKFVVLYSMMNGYIVLAVAAASALTKSLLQGLLHIDDWSQWSLLNASFAKAVTDLTVSTVLGVCGVFVIFAAFVWGLVFFVGGAATLVLTATAPITISGLPVGLGKTWFPKAARWFHAAILSPPLMVLVLGIGTQLASGVARGQTDSASKAFGTAVPAVMLLLVACFSPLALFKLLAFVDPTTASGAAARAGWDAAGGFQGLMNGQRSGGSTTASSTDSSGRSAGESASDQQTESRVARATSTQNANPAATSDQAAPADTTDQGSTGGTAAGLKSAASKVGGALGTGVAWGASIAASASAMGSDITNQMGVGHHSYQPDFRGTRTTSSSNPSSGGDGPRPDAPTEPGSDTVLPPDNGEGTTQGWTPPPAPAQTAATRPIPQPQSQPRPGAGGAGEAAGGAEAAAVIV